MTKNSLILLLVFQLFLEVQAQKNLAVNEYIGLYQKYISGVRPIQCPMFPSCSSYGLSQFRENNFFNAFIKTSDRLMRCGHEPHLYQISLNGPTYKFLDNVYDSLNERMRYRPFTPFFIDGIQREEFRVIKQLVNNEFYDAAILEIQRLFVDKSLTDNDSLNFYYQQCLLGKGLYEKAIYHYEVSMNKKLKQDFNISFTTARAWAYLENFKKSNDLLKKVTNQSSGYPQSYMALMSYNYLRNYQFDSVKYVIDNLELINSSLSQQLRADLTSFIDLQKSKKNPVTAGVLSIVPGAGYYYTRHRQTALTALLINSLLVYATFTSIKTENYGLAGLTGAFGLAFYIGNIQGSVKSARRFNSSEERKIYQRYEKSIGF